MLAAPARATIGPKAPPGDERTVQAHSELSPLAFAEKWARDTRCEQAAAHEHFIDLCRMLAAPTPHEADPRGEWYAFEKRAAQALGRPGLADVWKRGHFAWEYKGEHTDLEGASRRLLQHREALEDPPLLVVCDLRRFEVHTNFTGARREVHRFDLDALRAAPGQPLRVLHALMRDPDALRPTVSRAQITEQAADRFAELAGRLRARGHDSLAVAEFLNRLLLCLFAADARLLPAKLIGRIVDGAGARPERAEQRLGALFRGLARAGGGQFEGEPIQWLGGGLFTDDRVLPLDVDDLELLRELADMDWIDVEPAILGALFERGLDPAKRSQLGAHYTDRRSILRIVEPVVLAPLRAEFAAMQARVLALLARGKRATAAARGVDNPNRVFRAFLTRLRGVRVLDPACGSGNFLYIALQALKDLEKQVILWGARTLRLTHELPGVGPQVVHGLELNAYAAELARVTVWIGEIQWMQANGFGYPRDPVLRPLGTIEHRDALLDADSDARAEWPDAEFIVGNPPFLGGKKLRAELGDAYVDRLFAAWAGAVPREADLVTYWHEQARDMIARGRCKRAGLLATQGIRGGANLEVLRRIKSTGDIFVAYSDDPWVVDGAAVRVSVVGQDDGSEQRRDLDGRPVAVIHADLTGGARGTADLTTARRLQENLGVAFMGDTKGGSFEVDPAHAAALLRAPPNADGRPNSDVVVPWVNGLDVTRRPRGMHIIDFGVDMSAADAARYAAPFAHVRRAVQPARASNKREAYRDRWWIHVEPRPGLRAAIAPLPRFIVTPTVARHRIFTWLRTPTLPDHQLIVVARADAYTLGVLHSRVHELWSLRMGTRLGLGNDPRYTPTTTFETFPFPWPLTTTELDADQRAHRDAIAGAAEALVDLRERWLAPPDASAKELARRTLTRLYNARPSWLQDAHAALDAAVLAAYGWPADLTDEEVNRLRGWVDANLRVEGDKGVGRAPCVHRKG